jgi:hypothetical protein
MPDFAQSTKDPVLPSFNQVKGPGPGVSFAKWTPIKGVGRRKAGTKVRKGFKSALAKAVGGKSSRKKRPSRKRSKKT